MAWTVDVRPVTPDAFGPADVVSENTVVLGVPHIGKSERAGEFAAGNPGLELASDPSATALTVFYSRALPLFSTDSSPDSESEAYPWLLETASTAGNVDPSALYSAYLTQLHRSGSHDRAWFAAVASDAVERLRTGRGLPDDTHTRADTAAAAVAEALHLHDRVQGMSGHVPERVVAAVETVKAEDFDRIEGFVEEIADRLESEYDAFLLAGEWRLAFGAD